MSQSTNRDVGGQEDGEENAEEGKDSGRDDRVLAERGQRVGTGGDDPGGDRRRLAIE
jgi:hypothetical protein